MKKRKKTWNKIENIEIKLEEKIEEKKKRNKNKKNWKFENLKNYKHR